MSTEGKKIQHTGWDIFLTILVVVYNLLFVFYALAWLFGPLLDDHKKWFLGNRFDPNGAEYALSCLFFAGAIGGSFYCLRSIYERLSDAYTRNPVFSKVPAGTSPTDVFNIKVWLFWYFFRPIQSAVVAVVVICLFNQGLLNIGSATAEKSSSIYFQIGLGFLIGFGTHEVLGKIEEVIQVLFARKPTPNITGTDVEETQIEEVQENGTIQTDEV